MQNDELQRVFNISELPISNHRYNGFVLPNTDEKHTVKAKKPSPKPKKHVGPDMVTSSDKPVVKRKPRVKGCVKGRDSVIVNGINATNNQLPNQKEFNSLTDKYRCNNLNNFNRTFDSTDVNSVESISSILSSLSKDINSNSNNRLRLANPLKYTEVNHARNSDAGGSGYTKNFALFSTEGELKSKTCHVNNFSALKFNNNTATASLTKCKLAEIRKKDEELPVYSPEISSVKTILPNNQFDGKTDVRFVDRNKLDKEPDKKIAELNSNKIYENKLFLRAKKRKQNTSKWQMDNGTRHEALQRIRSSVELHENLRNDLFPLNVGETVFEKSDSDSSEEHNSTFQNNWFHSMAEIEFDDVKRSFRLGQLYNELRRQWYQIKQNKCDAPIFTEKFMKSLIEAARTRPLDAIHCLEEQDKIQTAPSEPLILAKKKCAIESCKNVCLPCTPTCVRHVLYCEKQTLFEQCRVRESNDMQCDRPVLNIKYHYPVCSVHSKPDFVLPDFSREDIKYEDVRNKNTCSTSDIYKIDFDVSCAKASTTVTVASKPPQTSSKFDATKKKNHATNGGVVRKTTPIIRTVQQCTTTTEKPPQSQPHHQPQQVLHQPSQQDKLEKKYEKPEVKYTKNGELEQRKLVVDNAQVLIKEVKGNQATNENQNLLRDWVHLSDNQLVDAKTLENTLQNEFVNGFDINSSTIQSQIQDIINSETSLSPDMLMGSHEIPNYIQVEEMIEEVEITDEGELNNQELVHSEDLNAVLKQLPPEAFNELFSDKNDASWGETQALERVMEEMDVRKCPLIDPSLLLEDIEPSYENYSNNFDGNTLAENVESRFDDLTPENCSQSRS